ncbi:MAG TPA: GAF domain-containing sensor histidine kinase [Anaerolineaceae bacterium]|nr:GAF domain-containing sensor histidine kinase [Anaerolineaceae bacterium]
MDKIDVKNKGFFDKIFSNKGKDSDSNKIDNLPNWEFILDSFGNYLNISEEVKDYLGIRPEEFDSQSVFTFSICQSSGEKLFKIFQQKKFPLEEEILFVSIDNKQVKCNLKMTAFTEEFNAKPTYFCQAQVVNISSKSDPSKIETENKISSLKEKDTVDLPQTIDEGLNINASDEDELIFIEENLEPSELFISPTERINIYSQEVNHLTEIIDISKCTFSVLDELFPNYNLLIGLINKDKQFEIPILRVSGDISYFPDGSDYLSILEAILNSEREIQNIDTFSSRKVFDHFFKSQTSTYIGLPIKSGKQCLGSMLIYDHSPGDFLPGDVEILRKISTILANALQNAEIYHDMQNALDAIDTREKYQYQILQAVKIISCFGSERLQEALEFLGKATNVNRIFFAIPRNNTDSLKWMIKVQWYAEEKYNCSHLSQEIPVELIYEQYSRIQDKGYFQIDYENLDSQFSRWLEIRGTKSIFFHSVKLNTGDFCLLGFENLHQSKYWKNDEITYIGFISEILSKNLEKENQIFEIQTKIETTEKINDLKKLITDTKSIHYLLDIINSHIFNSELDYGLILSLKSSYQNRFESYEIKSQFSKSELFQFHPSFLDMSFINALDQSDLPLYFEDIEFSPIPQSTIQKFQNQNIQSIAVIPLLSKEGLIGMILLCSSHQREYSLFEREALANSIPELSLTIENHLLFDEIENLEKEISEVDDIKRKFISNITHEFRTPLNSIIGFSKVIMTGIDGPTNETQNQDLAAIYNGGQYLLRMINDILDLSKIEAGKLQLNLTTTNIKSMIQSLIPQLEGLIKEKIIELHVEISEFLPEIELDKDRIKQVILNLVSNAVKNTDFGKITISATFNKMAYQNGEILIIVKDTGKGINESDRLKLFTPFFQSEDHERSRSSGSGLGLAISKAIVNLHNGDIGLISSIPGEGSEFFISLPVT